MLPAGAGLGTAFHDVPFHRRIKGCIDGVPQWLHPAAQARRAETAARPLRELPAGAGLGARFHDVPFQCRIRALPPVVRVVPAAQASRAVTAATASSPPPSGAGVSACFQEFPFHRSIRVLDLLPQLAVQPTAQALRAEAAATARRTPPAGPGLRRRLPDAAVPPLDQGPGRPAAGRADGPRVAWGRSCNAVKGAAGGQGCRRARQLALRKSITGRDESGHAPRRQQRDRCDGDGTHGQRPYTHPASPQLDNSREAGSRNPHPTPQV